jgi:hypothetical protein
MTVRKGGDHCTADGTGGAYDNNLHNTFLLCPRKRANLTEKTTACKMVFQMARVESGRHDGSQQT